MSEPLEWGTEQTVTFVIPKAGSDDFASSSDWTPATGDVKITKDAGNVANVTNLPEAVGGTGSVIWKWTIAAAEAQAVDLSIQIVDSATKAIKDQHLKYHTRLSGAIFGGKVMARFTVNTANVAATDTTCNAVPVYPSSSYSETTADHFIGKYIHFYDSSVATYPVPRRITDSAWDATNSEFQFTFDSLPGATAPANGDPFFMT